MTHAELQRDVIEAALVQHFEAPYHTHDSRKSEEGFPDLVTVHVERRRVLFVELKRQDDYLTFKQRRWRDWLLGAGAEYYLWRPSDLLSGEIDAVLAMRTKPVMMRRDIREP